MNATVARLTARTLLGRRRALVLVALPAVLILLAVVVRAVSGPDDPTTVTLLGSFGLGTLVPLLGVVVGTGAIGPEIDDGSIVYLLSKPLSRHSIIMSKLSVAVAVSAVFGAVPVFAAGLVLSGLSGRLAIGYGLAAAAAGAAYCAVFLLLAVLTRNAVVAGLLYALLWETTVAGVVPGARALSIRQWALSITDRVVGARDLLDVNAAVGLTTGLVLLVVVTAAATWWAGERLRSLRLTSDE